MGSHLMRGWLWVLTMAVFFILPEGWNFVKGCRWLLLKISFGICLGKVWLNFSL